MSTRIREESLPALARAALALDEEMMQFEKLTTALIGLSLDSERNLERAAETLKTIADSDERLGQLINQLVGVIAKTRDAQQAQAGQVQHRAEVLKDRTQKFAALQQDFQALGTYLSEM